MTRFEQCLAHVLRHEGGYVDHPNDPGGATNFGITRKTLARWRGVKPWWKLSKSEVRRIKSKEIEAIYRARYWRRCGAPGMPKGLDLALFDFAVNSGPSRAVKTLQSIVGSLRDGVVGPITLAAVRRANSNIGAHALINQLCQRRLVFLRRLPAFSIFGRGWSRRVQSVRQAALRAAERVTVSPIQPRPDLINQRNFLMQILTGYKTYIVATAMLIAGIGQMLGIDLPGFEQQASGQLVFEALAILFFRKGLKNEIAGA
ncbi:MAG: glycoside hydrolase family 108 protein [Devosiaceae bacterium]|nr:glycoside hydrolase family 108 protein [Devosiaceae bacterium]